MPPRDKAAEVERLAAGWRRLLELVERCRREREGEEVVRLEPRSETAA